jgi:hypothetical protein
MVGFYAWFAFLLKPIFALYLNRRTVYPMILVGSLAAIGSYVLLATASVSPYLASAAIGVSLALAMPSLFALPAFLLPEHQSGLGYGLLALLLSFELFTTPVVGCAVDATHTYAAAYTVMGVYNLIALLGVILLALIVSRRQSAATL